MNKANMKTMERDGKEYIGISQLVRGFDYLIDEYSIRYSRKKRDAVR